MPVLVTRVRGPHILGCRTGPPGPPRFPKPLSPLGLTVVDLPNSEVHQRSTRTARSTRLHQNQLRSFPSSPAALTSAGAVPS